MPRSVRMARAEIPSIVHDGVGVLGCAELAGARHGLGARPQQRQQAALERALVQLHGVADAEAADHVEQLLEGDALGVEQDLLAGVEDAQVARASCPWG